MNHVINWLFLACGFPVAQIEVYSRVCLACQVPDIVLIPHTPNHHYLIQYAKVSATNLVWILGFISAVEVVIGS